MTPTGYQQLTVSTTSVGLTVPATVAEANFALIRCSTNDVRWRDDGTDPTATVGVPLKANETLEYDGRLRVIEFIRSGAADATLDITYYRA